MTDQEHRPPSNPKDSKDHKKSHTRDYMKYSGMAFQMGIIIFIGSFAGQKLDAHFQTSKPYFTVFLALIAVILALYVSLKDLFYKPDKED